MSVFSELRRRNVWRVAAVYIVAAWLILQVADVLVPALVLPEYSIRLVTPRPILGFPLALIFSWVYELTPEGIKRERDVPREESTTRRTGRKLNALIVVLMILAIGGLIADRFIPESSTGRENAVMTRDEISASDDVPMPRASPSPPAVTIAVLPFEARNETANSQLYATALADKLRLLLSNDQAFKVTGTTSSNLAAQRRLDFAELREQLGVAHALRGSVAEENGRLAVHAELVGTSDGFTIWSQAYERAADQAFSLPQEFATSIVAVLLEGSTEAEVRIGNSPMELSSEASRGDLLGTYFIGRDTSEDYRKAITEFERVVELEPDYAMGWARLGRARLGAGARTGVAALIESARHAADRAIALDPELAEPWTVLAGIKLTMATDYAGAHVAIQRSMRLNPNTEYATRLAGVMAAAYGRTDEALQLSVAAAELDPLSSKSLRNASLYALYSGNLDLAIQYSQKAIDINPDTPIVRYIMARAMADSGEIARAFEVIDQEPIEAFMDFGRAFIYVAADDQENAGAQIAMLIDRYSDIAAVNLAELHAKSGKKEAAFEWLQIAADQGDAGLYDAPSMREMNVLHDDPRWQAFIAQAGLQPP